MSAPSLGPVLDLIERWQQTRDYDPMDDAGFAVTLAVVKMLDEVDIPALRALAEQHAAQLREVICEDNEDGEACDSPTCKRMSAAADFLAAPRRDGT